MKNNQPHLPPKLEATLVRLCERLGPLTKTRAVKLPYLVDVIARHALGRRITEGTHQTWDYGVVTREVYRLVTHGTGGTVFKIEPHPFSEGGQQISLRRPVASSLNEDELAVVDLVADRYGGLDAGRLGALTKALNTDADPGAWGSNHEAAVNDDAYARLSESWQSFSSQLTSLDFRDRRHWGDTIEDTAAFLRETLRGYTSSAQATHFPSTAEEFIEAVRSSLAEGKAETARRTAAEGAARFPDDPWLTRANRIVNPTKVVARPADALDRTQEFAWLHEHSAQYRGSWVALLKDELLASGKKLDDVLQTIRERGLESDALVHRIVV